jgi:hypothetical protein
MRTTSSILVAGLALAAGTVAAQAQQGVGVSPGTTASQGIGQHVSKANAKDASDGTKVKANDKAYNAALKNLPDKQFDPWRGVR